MGYILKDSSPEDLVLAIRRVHQGESSLHPMVARRVLRELAQPLPHVSAEEPLTEREIDVLRLIAHGESNHEIGVNLGISEATVRKHVSNILSKLHLASRTQAALYALREGFTSLQHMGGAA
jgi:NarL family two-component system response regulator LiaR